MGCPRARAGGLVPPCLFRIFPAASAPLARHYHGPRTGEAELSDNQDLLRLAGRARTGERKALESLLERVRPYLSALARAACSRRDGAEDVLQESLLEVYRSITKLREDKALLPWLRAVVRNNAADRGRRRAGRRELPLEAAPGATDDSAPGGRIEAAERRGALLEALDRLGEEEREMLILRHEAGLSLEEIARATGHSPRAVESRLFRARRALRAALSRSLDQ